MKIMTAMYTLRKGGAYDRFVMMVEAFLERKCEVHCLSLTPIPIKHPYYHNHVASFLFGMKGSLVARLTVLFLFPLFSLLIGWREKIDLFVAFGSLYAFTLAIPKWVLKRPVVTLIRGDSTFGLKIQDSPILFLWINRMIEYFGLMFSDRIITNNTAFQGEIVRKFRRRKQLEIEVLFNNIPAIPDLRLENISQIRAQFGIPMEAKVLVTAGILNRGKNIETLLKCLPKVGISNLFLLIIGGGTTKADEQYLDNLRNLTKTLGLEKKVFFAGWFEKEGLWRIFRAADLFVLPSKREGMPNVLLEALGVGLQSIGSNISGIRDILHHEILMFDPFDEKTLAQKIIRFFSEKDFSVLISQLCVERKQKFLFDWKAKAFEMITRAFA
jgi:glycosyltransferase involved in cell wall biosynthesis